MRTSITRLNSVDFNILVANFGALGVIWDRGDFNYNGGVDTTDFNLLAANFGKTLPSEALGGREAGGTVPEPSGCS